MLNADLHMKNEVTTKKQSKKSKSANADEDAGFHFIAYVPVEDHVWKLDGLERQPQRLGMRGFDRFSFATFTNGLFEGSIKSENWIRNAKPDIEARMAEYEEDQIEFAILSLVKDPLLESVPALADNVKGLQALASHLKSISTDTNNCASLWDQHGCVVTHTLTGPDLNIGLTADVIEQAKVASSIQSVLHSHEVSDVVASQEELCIAQAPLWASVRDECEAQRLDVEKANARRHDYGPLAIKLAQILARRPIDGYAKSGSRSKKQKR